MERSMLRNYPHLLTRSDKRNFSLKKNRELEESTLESYYKGPLAFKKFCLRGKDEEILLDLYQVLEISPFLSKLFHELLSERYYAPNDQVCVLLDDEFPPRLLSLLQQLLETGECVGNTETERKELTDLIAALGMGHMPFFDAPVSSSSINREMIIENQNRLGNRIALNQREERPTVVLIDSEANNDTSKKLDNSGDNNDNSESKINDDSEAKSITDSEANKDVADDLEAINENGQVKEKCFNGIEEPKSLAVDEEICTDNGIGEPKSLTTDEEKCTNNRIEEPKSPTSKVKKPQRRSRGQWQVGKEKCPTCEQYFQANLRHVCNSSHGKVKQSLAEDGEIEKGGRKHKLDRKGENDFNEEEYEPVKKSMKLNKEKIVNHTSKKQLKECSTSSDSSSSEKPDQNLKTTEHLVLNIGDMAYAMYNNPQREFKKCKIIQKDAATSTFKVKFEERNTKSKKAASITVTGNHLALFDPPKHELAVGTRCIALYTDEDDDVAGYFPAIVAESPTQQNDSRYLIFFDDGYMNYLYLQELREVVDSVVDVQDGPCDPEFIQNYLEKFPDYPVLSLAKGDKVEKYIIEEERWVEAKVEDIDASLVFINPGEDYDEGWMYMGSPLLRSIGEKSQVQDRDSVKKMLCINGCGEEFTSEETLKSHIENCDFKDDERVLCKLCEDTDYRERNLSEHLYRKHKDLKSQLMKYITDKFSPNTSIYTFEKNKTIWTCSLCSKEMKGMRSGVSFHWAVDHRQILNLYDSALKERKNPRKNSQIKNFTVDREKKKVNSQGQSTQADEPANSSTELEFCSVKKGLHAELEDPANEEINPLKKENEDGLKPTADTIELNFELEFKDNLKDLTDPMLDKVCSVDIVVGNKSDMAALETFLLFSEATKHQVENTSKKSKNEVIEELWDHYVKFHEVEVEVKLEDSQQLI